MAVKIATCCYCGARAPLKLTGETRHELACASCGAPLHELKQMPVSRDAGKRAQPQRPDLRAGERKKKKKKKKKDRSLGGMFMREVFDVIDDIFD